MLDLQTLDYACTRAALLQILENDFSGSMGMAQIFQRPPGLERGAGIAEL